MLQECLELVRQQRQADALAYARKHFPPLAQDHFPELRRAMAALAFGADTTCSRYAELFDPGQWDLLVELFQKDLFQMHFLTSRSMLDLHLQVGSVLPSHCPEEVPQQCYATDVYIYAYVSCAACAQLQYSLRARLAHYWLVILKNVQYQVPCSEDVVDCLTRLVLC